MVHQNTTKPSKCVTLAVEYNELWHEIGSRYDTYISRAQAMLKIKYAGNNQARCEGVQSIVGFGKTVLDVNTRLHLEQLQITYCTHCEDP